MSDKISVLLVTNTYPTSEEPGATPCIEDQISALREKGVGVDLLYIDRTNKLNYLRAAWKLFLMSFQSKRYDLIHAHYGHCGLLARLQFKYPVIVTYHGSDLISRKDGTIGKIVARMVEGVIVMTERMKHASRRKDAYVIPFGINSELFTPRSIEQARRELGLPLNDRLILFPWCPERRVKRFDIVKESIQILKEDYEDVHLVVACNKPREIVARYMAACDAMILASDYEGSPMAVREAMACGLPIVSVDVGDVRQIIGNTEGCYVCEQEAADLAEKLSWALSRGKRTDGAKVVKGMDAAWAAEQVISVYNLVLDKA